MADDEGGDDKRHRHSIINWTSPIMDWTNAKNVVKYKIWKHVKWREADTPHQPPTTQWVNENKTKVNCTQRTVALHKLFKLKIEYKWISLLCIAELKRALAYCASIELITFEWVLSIKRCDNVPTTDTTYIYICERNNRRIKKTYGKGRQNWLKLHTKWTRARSSSMHFMMRVQTR